MCSLLLPRREQQASGSRIRTRDTAILRSVQVSLSRSLSSHLESFTHSPSGFRVPSYIISPWTRGGKVFTEHSDHSSHIRFVEQWAAANGYSGVQSKELTPWRRSHISDLVNAFDFDNVSINLFSTLYYETGVGITCDLTIAYHSRITRFLISRMSPRH